MLKATRVRPFDKGKADPTFTYTIIKLYDYYLKNQKTTPNAASNDKSYDRLEAAIRQDATIDLINMLLMDAGYDINSLHRLDFSKKSKK